ncbi:MAG: ComEC/Rec2 family competence protein [Caldimicrobium thiodismutans]
MKNPPLFIFTISLFLGLFTAYYDLPLWFSLLFLPLVFLFFSQKESFRIFLLYLVFYLLGTLYFNQLDGLKDSIKERYVVKIEKVEPSYNGTRILARLDGSDLIEFTSQNYSFKPGQLCEVSLIEKRWYKRANPFTPEEKELLRIKEIKGLFNLNEKERIYCLEGEGYLFETLRFRLFQFSEKLSPLAKGLFQALVLGVEAQLPQEYLETLKNQGLYHQLAISGFNLAVLFGLLYKVFRFFLGYTPFLKSEIPIQIGAYLLALPGALIILVFSGFQPPALRAFFFLVVYILSKILFRHTPLLFLLFLTGDLLLIANPNLIGNLSFQLSFLATLALIIGDMIYREKISPSLKTPFLNKPLSALFISLLVSLFTFPLIIKISGEIPLVTPLNNLIATPFWSLLFIPISIFSALLSFVSEPLAIFIMEKIAKVFNFYIKIPLFSCLFRPPFSVNLFIIWYLFLFISGILLWKIEIKRLYKLVTFGIIAFLSYSLLKSFYARTSFIFWPKLYTLQAFLIKDYEKFYLITDEEERSALERNILLIPLLKKMGVNELEGVLFLKETPLKDYLSHFSIKEIYQKNEPLEEKKRIFKPQVEFIFLDDNTYLIEFRGLTLLLSSSRNKFLPKAEFSLKFLEKSLKRDSAYLFFPKENYILVINERKRRRDILNLLFFPFVPYYIERGDFQKIYYNYEYN